MILASSVGLSATEKVTYLKLTSLFGLGLRGLVNYCCNLFYFEKVSICFLDMLCFNCYACLRTV